MAAVWFCGGGGNGIGPLTIEELHAALLRQPVPGKVKVWRKGLADWQDADQVDELVRLLAAPPPPPPVRRPVEFAAAATPVGSVPAVPAMVRTWDATPSVPSIGHEAEAAPAAERTGPPSRSAPPVPREPAVWGPWRTLRYLLVGMLIGQAFPFAVGFVGAASGVREGTSGLLFQPVILASWQLVSAALVIPYFIRAARRSGLDPAGYLGIKPPTLLQAAVGLAVITLLLITVVVAAAIVRGSSFQVSFAWNAATLDVILVGLATVVLAPIHEEIAFRGFAIPGIARAWGAPAAILITTVLWAVLHLGQVGGVGLAAIGLGGLALGVIRLRTGSTVLTIGLHAFYNFVILFGVVIQGLPLQLALAPAGGVPVAALRPLAEQGDARAQTELGLAYFQGINVPKDTSEGVKWFRKAAEQGSPVAQNNLGVAYSQGQGLPQDPVAAVDWYRKAADQGYALSQYNLGRAYAFGRGVTQDYAEALRLYRLAAAQRAANAQNDIGVLYNEGNGVAQDYAEAARWYRQAAEQGYAPAQTNLGKLYTQGNGVMQDPRAAAEWFRKAADQRFAVAQHNLGFMYASGQGVPRDYAKAAELYRLAADQDFAGAQLNIGRAYALGEGVPQDFVQAYVWFSRAAAQGDAQAATYKSAIAKLMNAAQLAEAQRLLK